MASPRLIEYAKRAGLHLRPLREALIERAARNFVSGFPREARLAIEGDEIFAHFAHGYIIQRVRYDERIASAA